MPLLTRLFNTRLDILAVTLNSRDNPAYAQAIADCRAMLARLPLDSFLIRKVWRDVQTAWTDDFWSRPSTQAIDFLRLKVAPLLRYVPDVDVAAETFTNKVERLALAMLNGQPSPDQLASIADDVARLPQATRDQPSKKQSAQVALSNALAQATRAQLAELSRLPGGGLARGALHEVNKAARRNLRCDRRSLRWRSLGPYGGTCVTALPEPCARRHRHGHERDPPRRMRHKAGGVTLRN
jgi:type I site-specific restriction endonuclease